MGNTGDILHKSCCITLENNIYKDINLPSGKPPEKSMISGGLLGTAEKIMEDLRVTSPDRLSQEHTKIQHLLVLCFHRVHVE